MFEYISKIIDFVLPPRCISCGKTLYCKDGVCEECFNKINFITKPYCCKCGTPFESVSSSANLVCATCIREKRPVFRISRSAIRYDDISKNMILAFKFMDKTENAKVLSQWLKVSSKDIIDEGVDLVVPVPLHFTRLIKRKYNQSALLVKRFSKSTGLKADYSVLAKTKRTKPQVEFSGKARVKNIKGVFEVKYPNKVKGKRILLIDDVYTTGSTLKECAKVLKKAGAKSVDFLTIARTC